MATGRREWQGRRGDAVPHLPPAREREDEKCLSFYLGLLNELRLHSPNEYN